MIPDTQCYEVIVVGGSFAGMTAALQLVRARRQVLVIDAGFNRNRMVRRSYGFLGQDGSSPDDFIHRAKQQLLKYPNLEWHDEVIALKAEKHNSGNHVTCRYPAGGQSHPCLLYTSPSPRDS